ncbi:MAG: DinB family protein [Gemmatimonadetes bacterium]|nr:DinB family protein [Gemmatimonadota bacterium]
MSLRTTLRDNLLNVWVGDPWYGSSGRKILDGITAADAAARPVPGVHNIWESVLHLVAWTDEVAHRVQGEMAKEPARGDWPAMPEPANDEAWKRTLAELGAARQAVLDALDHSHEEDLHLAVKESGNEPHTQRTRVQTLAGLAEHDVYHFGQIALLKKALRGATAK